MTAPFDLLCQFAPGAGPFDVIGTHYLATTAETSSYASTPDAASLDITGDIDVRVDVELDDWLQPGPNGQALAGKWNGTGNQRSWVFWVWAGLLVFSWSTDGTAANSFSLTSSVPLPFGAGRHTVRAALQVNLLGVSHSVAFYTSSAIDGSFTALGDLVTDTGTTSIFSSSASQFVAHIDNPDLALNAAGKFYEAEVRNGIGGTVVANPDFSAQAVGATSFSDTATPAKTWTVQADANIAGFDWVDLSDRILSADWEIGRDGELDHFPAGEATIVLNNDDRQLDPEYTAGTWFGELLPRVPFRLRSVHSALNLVGAFGAAYASTPDTATLDITGDIDLRADVTLDDWTPASATTLVSKWLTTGNQRSYLFQVNTAGNLRLIHSPDGTVASQIITTSTTALSLAAFASKAVRVTMDVNDGSGNRVVNFYTSDDGGGTWDQLGATVTTAGTTSIFSGSAQLEIGSFDAGATERIVNGRVRFVEVRSGIDGTIVANPDFMIQRPGTTTFTDGTGKAWTLTGITTISVATSDPYDEFYGFVDGGWEQDLEPPERARCVVKLVDKLAMLGGYDLPDVYHHSILARDPLRFWVLDGPSGSESVADMTGIGLDGAVVGSVTFGEPPVMPGHGTSARFDASVTEFGRIEVSRSPIIPAPATASVVATFKARSAGTLNFRTLFVQHNGNVNGTVVAANVDTNGFPQFAWAVNGGGQAYEIPTSIIDGEGHILFGQSDGIAIDTATLTTTTVSVATGICNGVGIGGFPGIQAEDHWDGWICAVAIFDRLLLEQERELIHEGHEMLAGELSGAHISWALDRIGVPLDHRDIADGTVIMGPAETAGRDALDWIREVAATEQGGFYVDHRNGGKLRFIDRYHRFLATRSTVTQETFSDDPAEPGANVVRIERGELDKAPNGTDSIVNQVTVRWQSGDETVSDQASIDRYGPATHQITTQATTANQARSSAEWIVSRYAQPRSRIQGLGIHPSGARRGFRAARHLRIDDRVTVREHPQQIGTATTTALFVEGARHSVEGLDWQTRYHLSPDETFTPWIWGVSEWDTETFWG